MAAQPVSDRELAAVHERVGRDVAELRRRWTRPTGRSSRSPGAAVKVLVEVFRVLQAARGVTSAFRRGRPLR
jgi:hypothetical protein